MSFNRRQWLAAAALGLERLPAWAQPTSTALDAALAQPIIGDDRQGSASGVFFGIFREDMLPDVLVTAQDDLRRKPASVTWFSRFGAAYPENQLRFLHQRNTAAHITWEPWSDTQQGVALADIANGGWDGYIDSWARASARQGLPYLLRFGHEFNGDWYPWCTAHNGRDPRTYVRAFRRVVERFREAGAHHVQWVWCFNNDSAPAETWNDPRAAWPGEAYVDWIGIDGYNFGRSRDWARWVGFKQMFAGPLGIAKELAPHKPVMLAETGCSEVGGDKSEWVRNMFDTLASLPSVRSFTWFDTNKETSWAFTSSDASWLAAIQGLRSPHIRSDGDLLLSIPFTQRQS